jgi:hypothetical protein
MKIIEVRGCNSLQRSRGDCVGVPKQGKGGGEMMMGGVPKKLDLFSYGSTLENSTLKEVRGKQVHRGGKFMEHESKRRKLKKLYQAKKVWQAKRDIKDGKAKGESRKESIVD